MDTDIRKMETNIAQALRIDKRMGSGMGSPTTTLEYCRQDFLDILPWLQMHLIRQSDQGSAPHREEHKALTGTRVTKEGSWTGLEGDWKPRTSSVTTYLSIGSTVLAL